MRDMIDFGGAFSALRGFSENHVTLKRALANARAAVERPAACRGRQRRTRRGGARRRERAAAGAGARRRGGEQRAHPMRYPAAAPTAETAAYKGCTLAKRTH